MKKNLKQFFAVLLSVVMIAGLIPLIDLPTAFADTWGGSYTTNSGYSISGTTISITSANGFAYIADRMVNGNYLTYTLNLGTDLDMNNIAFKGMTPYDNPFKGTFNGNGHTITNFKMDMSDNRVGLFRKADGCTVKDITFTNVSINGTKTGTGVVAGLVDGAACTFTNVKVTSGTVTGNARTGGIVGELNGSGHHTFTNCSNGAKISQTGSDIGGIVGSRQVNDYVTYINCSNTGEVYGNYAGGIMGWNKGFGNYTDCTNSGYIHTYNGGEAGGISGKVEDDKQIYTRCKNTGTITASGHAAGILGFIEKSSSTSEFYNCENTGTITSTGNCAGGMLGRYGADLDKHVFQNCINRGAVTASSRAGGMVGDNKGHAEYTNCVNYANISALGSDAGGICGYAEDDEQWMTDCINYGSVKSGSACAGGMIGYCGDSAAGTFTRCFNFGNVTAGSHGGGIIGGEDWGSPAGVVSYCMNWGDVNANNNGGGIVGNGNWLDVQLCFNKGNIKKRDNNTGYSVGGMVGDDSNRVENCFNTGTVRYGDYAAGMVGYKAYGSGIVNCYNAGSISNASNNYQIYGNSSAADTNNYYLSTASGTARSGETAKTAAQLQASDMPGQLNPSAYVLDTWNVNSKYPIHKWWRDGYFYFTANFTDGGSTVSSVRKLYNNSITAPTRSKTGYDFNGWYSGSTRVAGSGGNITAGVTTPMNTTSLTRAANTATWEGSATYTASWTAHTYTIRFNGNGSTYGMMENLPMVYDTAKDLPAVGFSRVFTVTYNYNYTGSSNTSATATATFNGWAESENGAKKYNDLQNVNNLTAENGATVNLFAKWTDASVTLPTPTRTGYTFGGWYAEDSCATKIGDGGASYTPTGNKTLFAKWTPITYTVSYDGNGSTSGATASSTHTYDVSSALTANGYGRAYTVNYDYQYKDVYNNDVTGSDTATAAFNGWATSASGAKVYDDGQSVLNLRNTAGNYPLFANWTLSTVTLPNPTRDGYQFGGWFTDSDCTQGQQSGGASVTPSANVTYFAKWTPNTYKVHFNGTDATGGEMADQDFTYDVPQALTANGFERKFTVNYEHNGGSGAASGTASAAFTGWAISSAGDWIYEDGETVGNLTATNNDTADLYARWGAMGSVTLPDSPMTGYTFNGWYSDEQLSNRVGGAGDSYTPAANGVTLYAKHTINTYTITFKGENGTVLDEQTVNYNVTPTAPAIPEKGPSSTQHFTGAWNTTVVPATADATYTVVYTGADHSGGEATCVEKAVCDVCGKAYGNLGGHSLTEVPAQAPGCLVPGHVAYWHCDVCGKDFTDETASEVISVFQNAHSYGELIAEVPAKCEEAGTVAHYHCSACGKDFDADKNVITDLVIPASGHTYGELIAVVPAKCEEAGTVAHYHCAACGKDFDADKNVITDLVIPASGHTYGDLIAEVPAKCEEPGTVAHYHCSVCGTDFDTDKNVITDLVIPASGHSYGELIAEVPAKCEEAGTVAHYHCDACGKDFDADKNVITDLVIPASGHTYGELIAEVPAKCEEAGTVAHYHCDACGKDFDADKNVITDLVIPTAGHTYGDLIAEVPAKCEEAGTVAHYHCEACGKDFDADKNVITDLVIPASGHTYGELIAVVPAKCEESGTVAHYHCEACGKDFDADKNVITDLVIPASGHAYGELIAEVPAKCEESGTVAHYHCAACGKDFDADKNVITDLVIPASGHTYGELIAVVPAKCEESGTVAHYHCAACGKDFDADKNVITDLVIPASGHTYGELIAEVPAKCEEAGTVAHYHCAACGKDFDADKNVITDLVIPAAGHTYGELIAEIPAKCEEAGTVVHYHCAACGKDFDADKNVITELTIPASGHAYGNWTKISDTQHQRVCGNDPTHVETAVHTWNDGEELDDATCMEPGHKLFTCTVCGATKEEDTAYGAHHITVHVIAKAPTCSEDGNPEYWRCETCGKYFTDENGAGEPLDAAPVLHDANAHSYGELIAEVPAKCEEAGTVAHYHCSACGKDFDADKNVITDLVIPASGHTYGELIAEVPAKCEEAGTVAHYHCSACNKDFDADKNVITDLVIPASGHAYGELIAEVPAKCEEAGTVAHYHCAACGKDFDADKNVITDLVIPASGHTYGELIAEVPAKCEEAGTVAHYHCSACGKDFDADKNVITDLVIPASGHTSGSPVKENETPATCTEAGSYELVTYCAVCETELSRESFTIPAGHTAGDPAIENEVAPTCTEDGSHEVAVYCTECGEEISRTTVTDPAKGHVWGEWEIVTPATEEEDGLAKHVCTVCGEEETKPLSALGEEVTKMIRFINIAKMHYVLDLGDGETYTIYNSSVVQWISNKPLKFTVYTYSGYQFEDIVIRANGVVIEPDEDGYYSLPQTAETVIVSAEGAIKDDTAPGGKLSFWELLIRFFRSIVAFFSASFGKS